MSRIYKILSRAEWRAARAAGSYEGSAVDLQDGFIHFSTGAQAQETAIKHFSGRLDLVVLEVETEDLQAAGGDLRWEPSRGGALFPHLYGPLPASLVLKAHEAPLGEAGTPQLGRLA